MSSISEPSSPSALDQSSHTSPPMVEIDSLSVHFPVARSPVAVARRAPRDAVRAVDGVDLAIRRGESLGLVGESGSGKSTLARCLTGLIPATAGRIVLDGQELTPKRSLEERRHLQMVFQDPYSSLNPRMTVKQMLREPLRVHNIVPRGQATDRAAELLDLVGLSAQTLERYPRNLSGGQRQRVGIARALALEPRVLVADEPVSALDVSVQAGILALLEDLRSRLGLTLLFITHNLAVVRHVCDRVAVMYLGRVAEVAGTETLFEDPRHPYTQALIKAAPRLSRRPEHRRSALRGELPSAIRPPAGCRFHTRCPVAAPVCAEREPDLSVSSADAARSADPAHHADPAHRAACHFAWDNPQLVPRNSGRPAGRAGQADRAGQAGQAEKGAP